MLLVVHSIREFCRGRGASTGDPKNIVLDIAGCDMRRSLLLIGYEVLWWVEKSTGGANEGTNEVIAVGDGAEDPDILMSPVKELLFPKFNISDFKKSFGWDDSIFEVICLPGLEVGISDVVGMPFWYGADTDVRISGLTIEPSPRISGIDEAIRCCAVGPEVQGFVNCTWLPSDEGGWNGKPVCIECLCWLSRAILLFCRCCIVGKREGRQVLKTLNV